LNQIRVSLCPIAPPQGVEEDTIGVTKITNAKQPHYRGLVLIYPMENKMPLVHHTKEWWGRGYIFKDNKS
jgi:hypothetical protein